MAQGTICLNIKPATRGRRFVWEISRSRGSPTTRSSGDVEFTVLEPAVGARDVEVVSSHIWNFVSALIRMRAFLLERIPPCPDSSLPLGRIALPPAAGFVRARDVFFEERSITVVTLEAQDFLHGYSLC